jgi:hypothetical protein
VLSELTEYKPLFADNVKKLLGQAVVEEMHNVMAKSLQGAGGALGLSMMSKSGVGASFADHSLKRQH